jgi:hypothetical protein
MVDLVARTHDGFQAARARLAATVMHAAAHFDAEVLSALGRMQRGGVLTAAQVDDALEESCGRRRSLGMASRRCFPERGDVAALSVWPMLSTSNRLIRRAWCC